ncbi:MAG: DUF7712 family protein [Acidimicrobiales bacterium]
MNWMWSIRGRDGAMNGLEFTRAMTAGGFERVLVHAAPAQAFVEVFTAEDELVARGDIDRKGDYSPMTLLSIAGTVTRQEIWPDESFYGLPVLLAGGEVGALTSWRDSEDHNWWQWSVEFSNHTGNPPDWAPPGGKVAR